MDDQCPKRFDQILKKAEDDSQTFISGSIVLIVGLLRAAYTFPVGEVDERFSWSWKVGLFFGLLIPFLVYIWKTGRFALVKAYREAGAFMVSALKGPVTQDMPFRHLWRMREIAWAEHLEQQHAIRSLAPERGHYPILLADASGESIFEATRISCAGCGRSLKPRLAMDLWKEREGSQQAAEVPEDLTAEGRCVACGSSTGRFRTVLKDPVETSD